MAVNVIKAERIVRTMLGILERDVTLPALVWRDAGGDFRGARGDAITIRLPAYFNANKRALRDYTATGEKAKSSLFERVVHVTLTDNLYGVIPITDEELTLDIESMEEQVVAPVASGLVRGLEDELIAEMTGAPYVPQHQLELDTTNPYSTVARARRLLSDARVPMEGRALAIGSGVEEMFLNDPQFLRADRSGSTGALREAEVGRIAGFPVFTVPGLPPDEAYAFHRTAYVLNTRAPFVPRGVAWGSSLSWQGFSLRVAQQVDPDELVDNFHADVYVGTNYVHDHGAFNENGQFAPSVEPDLENNTDALFVRAVKITSGDNGGGADDDAPADDDA